MLAILNGYLVVSGLLSSVILVVTTDFDALSQTDCMFEIVTSILLGLVLGWILFPFWLIKNILIACKKIGAKICKKRLMN